MPQALLPLIPEGATRINDRISVVRENDEWTYFCGIDPVFCHPEKDRRSFQMFTAQLVCQGICRQIDIIRTFGVSTNSVQRSVQKYSQEGIAAFYRPRKGRGPTVMTDEVTTQAQELLIGGCSRQEVATQLGVRYDTLRKAINQGRLHEPDRCETSAAPSDAAIARVDVSDPPAVASDKSERSVADASAEMGVACTRP